MWNEMKAEKKKNKKGKKKKDVLIGSRRTSHARYIYIFFFNKLCGAVSSIMLDG